MIPEALNELVTLSDELARLQGKPQAAPLAPLEGNDIHPALAAVIASGALALERQGVDPTKIESFTANARSRGLRRKAWVFGWHPRGHTWYATPEHYGDEARVLVINRLAQLATEELTVEEYLQRAIEGTRTAIAEATAPEPEPEAEAEAEGEAAPAPRKIGKRTAKVVLLENAGATVASGGKTHTLSEFELGYITWCLIELQLTTEVDAPDLARWEDRALRTVRVDAVPGPKSPKRAEYEETWRRLSARDRGAPGPVSYQLPIYKLTTPGSWILAPGELAVLRRADKATPPRHKHTADQQKVWAKWIGIVQADDVEIHVK